MNLLGNGKGSIPITCPVHLIQGLGDEEIPPSKALKISESIKGEDVTVCPSVPSCVFITHCSVRACLTLCFVMHHSPPHTAPPKVTYVKYGSHEMDEDEDFKRIHTAVQDIDRQLGKISWSRSIQAPV